jgi:antitoxin component of RelBE/YafQ-DinJ toxin-antitoxin module
MHRTQVYIEDNIFEKVKQVSKSMNISVSEFIRNSLKKELNIDKPNDMESFFQNFEPLESFENTDPKKYVKNIRSKSRILEN